MKTANKILEYQTKGEFDFIDITEEVKKFVRGESQIKNGFVNVQTLHTTAAIILNENEPLLLEDIKKNLEKLSPGNIKYNHDDFTARTINMHPDKCANGHSHCKAIHLPVNIALNLIDGKIQLGQWQSIMLVELDRPRIRKVQIQVIGE